MNLTLDFFFKTGAVQKYYYVLGGVTEYVISVSCVVGMYRMKGAKVVKHLLPQPPTLCSESFVNNITEKGVQIMWEPPKKDFSNYSLTVQQEYG